MKNKKILPKVSLIIPVHNAALYLVDCLQSVLNQQHCNLEIIAVENGSSDNSIDILKYFESQDPRIQVITSGTGVSTARNAGIEIATGEYICFADADDYLSPLLVSTLVELMQSTGADLAVCNIENVLEGKKGLPRLNLQEDVMDYTHQPATLIKDLMQFRYDYAVWNKLYCNHILQNSIRFNPEVKMGEDLLFNLEYAQNVKKVVTCNELFYYYRIHGKQTMQIQSRLHIEEFIKVSAIYKRFCMTNKLTGSWQAFKKEMSRIIYYQFIHRTNKETGRSCSNYVQRKQALYQFLQKLDPEILSFGKEELRGYQGLKKRLLLAGYFRLFSTIAAFHSWKILK